MDDKPKKPKKKKKRSKPLPMDKRVLVRMGRTRRSQFLEIDRSVGKVSIALQHLGLSRSCYDRWRREIDGFQEEFDLAHNDFVDGIEEEARRRAVDGVERDIYHQGEKVGKEREYSDRLLAMLLKAHRPEFYRDNSRVEHSGEIANRVTIDYSRRLPSPEEARARVLAAAAMLQPASPSATVGNDSSSENGHHTNGNGHSNGHH